VIRAAVPDLVQHTTRSLPTPTTRCITLALNL